MMTNQPTVAETYTHLGKGGEVQIQMAWGRKIRGIPESIGSSGTVTLEFNGQRITRSEWELV